VAGTSDLEGIKQELLKTFLKVSLKEGGKWEGHRLRWLEDVENECYTRDGRKSQVSEKKGHPS
jgi:hypothetical protein